MNDLTKPSEASATPRRISASELRKLPLEERHRILEEQAKLAVAIYRDNPELTDLTCDYGPDDFYGESSSSETL